MVKISRPILYTLVLGTAAYAVVLLTEPDPPARKPAPPGRKTAARPPDGFTEADRTARFPRYSRRQRNAFAPGVIPNKSSGQIALNGGGIAAAGMSGVWSLTGINTVNGVRSALVENGTTRESRFLKAGDRWNGLSVIAIKENAVVFMNAFGQQTQLAFAAPAPALAPGSPALTAPGLAPGTPPRLPPVTPFNAIVAETPRAGRERESN